MVDMVVHRHKLRPTLASLCRTLTKAGPPQPRNTLPVPAAPPPSAAPPA
jgi:acetyl-CoA carboxylase carboxyl transferase subunit beta